LRQVKRWNSFCGNISTKYGPILKQSVLETLKKFEEHCLIVEKARHY